MGRAFGWSYDDLVMQVVDEALMRSQSHSRRRRPRQRGVRRVSGTLTTSPVLRSLTRRRPAAIEAITRATGIFRENEIAVALEVFDARGRGISGLHRPRRRPRWPIGRMDLLGTHSLHPRHLRSLLDGGRSCASGHGDRLRSAERDGASARGLGPPHRGRDVRPARLPADPPFYEARGYRIGGIIPEFYAPGDDQVVYVKRLSAIG